VTGLETVYGRVKFEFDPITNIFQFKEVFISGSPRLPDRARSLIRLKHYGIRTEEAHAHWVKRYVL
jgi:hypothetical protein